MQPVGTGTVSSAARVNQSDTWRKLSQYNLAEDAPVPGSQYSITLSSRRSRVSTSSGRSVHERYFSTIHAHNAAGESTSP